MLWSLFKILAFVAAIALAALGAGYLMEAEGGVRITVAGTEFTLGPLQSVIALLVLVLAIWLGLKVLSFLAAVVRFLNGDETAISRFFDRGRERRGYRALTEAMLALASGEGRQALSRAARAERLLRRPELTTLITAQAAELAGDRRRAEAAYKKLIADPATRFVGVRGALRQRLASGDDETARRLAEKALELKPSHAETQDILLSLQTRAEDWAGARRTLGAKLKSGTLPRDVFRRRDAVLALAQARDIVAEGASVEARERAVEANRLSPGLVPAAVMAARGYMEMGKPRAAARILRKAWEMQPHPDLAAAFAAIRPEESPRERLARFAALTKINPHHPETRLLLAELDIAAGDFPEARRALGDLVIKGGDARAHVLMAAIERGEGAPDSVVRGWLARALTAPRGPQWVCAKCHHVHAEWAPVCEECGAFDTLAWTAPPDSEATAAGAHMLPLVLGATDEAPAGAVAADGGDGGTATAAAETAAEDAKEAAGAEAEGALEDGPEGGAGGAATATGEAPAPADSATGLVGAEARK